MGNFLCCREKASSEEDEDSRNRREQLEQRA